MEPKPKQNQEKLDFWREHLTRLATSGMNQSEYCRTYDLNRFQLRYWRKKLERNQVPNGGRLRLIPIQPIGVGQGSASEQPGPSQIRLLFDEFILEVNDGFNPETLEKMLKVLRSRQC